MRPVGSSRTTREVGGVLVPILVPILVPVWVAGALLFGARRGLAEEMRDEPTYAEADRDGRGSGKGVPLQEQSLARTAMADRRQQLDKLAADAWRLARRRALSLYRVVRLRDAALGGGESPLRETPPAAAVSVGVAAFVRDLEEANALSAETRRFTELSAELPGEVADARRADALEEHARAVDARAADTRLANTRLADARLADAQATDTTTVRLPGLPQRAGTASCVVPLSASAFVQAGAPPRLRLRLARGASLLAPLAGELRPLGLDVDGRPIAAIEGRDGWTMLLSGGWLEPVAWVSAGQRLPWYHRRGPAEATTTDDSATWDIELWHGIAPIDPRTACRRSSR